MTVGATDTSTFVVVGVVVTLVSANVSISVLFAIVGSNEIVLCTNSSDGADTVVSSMA